MEGRDRPRLHDPEAGFVTAPFHILRSAVVRFDLAQERRQDGDVLIAQRRGAVRAVVGEASEELLAAGLVNDVLVGID